MVTHPRLKKLYPVFHRDLFWDPSCFCYTLMICHNVYKIQLLVCMLMMTQIYASSRKFTDLVAKRNKDLENIVKWLSHNKLQLNTKKKKVMFIGSSYKLKNKVGNDQVIINDKPVTRYTSFRCLGVELDEKLSRENHIGTKCNKAGTGFGIMKRVKPFVPYESLQNLDNSVVLSYFDYCLPLCDNCGRLLKEKIQKFQNRAARVMTGANCVKSSDLLHAVSWKNLNDRLKLNKLILIYKN